MLPKPKNIDQYIKSFPAGTQKILQQIRAAVKNTAPAAEEVISYSVAAFKLNKRILVYFAGWKEHVSLYPVPRGNQVFEKEISDYKTVKCTLKFHIGEPL